MVPPLVIRYRILLVGYICSHRLDRSYIGLPVRSDLPRSLRHMVFRWAVCLSTGNMDFHTSRVLTECSHMVIRTIRSTGPSAASLRILIVMSFWPNLDLDLGNSLVCGRQI